MTDPNEFQMVFLPGTPMPEDRIQWHSIRQSCFTVYGLCREPLQKDPPEYCRMPSSEAAAISREILELSRNTAGGRIRFQTDSPAVAIECTYPQSGGMPHMSLIGCRGFDLYETVDGESRFAGSFFPGWEATGEETTTLSILRFPEGRLRDLTLSLPLCSGMETLKIGLREGSVLKEGGSYVLPEPVVYYGSSVTQGLCASRPGNCYEAMIQRMLNLDFVNLGFSGRAKGEPAMARYISTLPMSAFVMDYDHNAFSAGFLRETHYPFYQIIRKAQPRLPILLVSRSSDYMGHFLIDETARIVEETFLRARAEGDEKIWYLDGRTLLDGPGGADCTVDGVHPNDLGFYRMAAGIARQLKVMLSLS